MKILVTGGAGFIGSHLVKRLIELGHELTIIDNLSTGSKKFIDDNRDKIKRFINMDIQNLRNHPIIEVQDIIYHLAANADVRGGTINTYKDIDENILGTHSLLEYIKNHNINNVIFTSSATIYGEMGYHKLKENECDFNPISMYGMSKLAAEKLIHVYHNNYGINAKIFRFNNITGPGNTHGVIRDFVSSLKKDSTCLKILGNGKQVKQYLDVEDCVEALLNVGMNSWSGFHVYNLAHYECTSVLQLAKIVIDEMKLNPKIIYSGGDRAWIGDVPITMLDIQKISDAGWKPTISTEESIRRTVRYLMKEGD